ncbi:beta-1,3-galactosyltransferase 5-like [Branchiostoma floridae]|uniref:Hexosyltransferase n=1 Tax=Branchiostoma floridae TaxID=7739 RepID=A0A9J7KG97_BRAFL|nr:beta-1,3-galactosyltransferase 5-like [Branchiostoma floridae]
MTVKRSELPATPPQNEDPPVPVHPTARIMTVKRSELPATPPQNEDPPVPVHPMARNMTMKRSELPATPHQNEDPPVPVHPMAREMEPTDAPVINPPPYIFLHPSILHSLALSLYPGIMTVKRSELPATPPQNEDPPVPVHPMARNMTMKRSELPATPHQNEDPPVPVHPMTVPYCAFSFYKIHICILPRRFAIRHTWGNETNVPGTVIKTVFAVGKPGNASTQRGLEYENKVYKDIIQEDFVDSYKNLTLKTVMCMKWASEFCPYAKFVMKADDDAFVNMFNLVRLLRSKMPKEFVTGHVYTEAKPDRRPDKRWYLSEEEYPRETFPKYPCGFAYVMSYDVTGLIYEVSLTLKYLFLEDVFLGLCLEGLSLQPAHDGRFFPWGWAPCETAAVEHVKERIASHWLKTYDAMMTAWQDVTSC